MRARFSAVVCAFLSTHAARAAPGDLDLSYNPGASQDVSGTALQPDGNLVIGGYFTSVSGNSRSYSARILANGSLDPSFNPSPNRGVQCTAVQRDGRSLAAGVFTVIGGFAQQGLARLNTNGSMDTSFVANVNDEVRCLMLFRDERILLGGLFTVVNGTSRPYLAVVNPNGSLHSMNPAPNDIVRCAAVQPDGKIVVGGGFTVISGTPRSRIARLNADGSLDTSFNPGVIGSALYCMALQADGKILIGGSFNTVGTTPRNNVARLNTDGTVDAAFNPGANNIVRCATVQTDGKIILTGTFTTLGGSSRNRIARVDSAGVLEPAFNPNANNIVTGTMLQLDGKIIASGLFTNMSGQSRNRIARLQNDPATQSLTVPSLSRIEWMRGGASQETTEVTFDLSTDGGFWTTLGDGVRITGGWELTGLTLPAGGHVRGRARLTGAYANGSSGIIETVIPYGLTPQQLWRRENFGTPDNAGPAADSADPDQDGLTNLVEYAFGRNPNRPDADVLPQWEQEEDYYVIYFTRPEEVSGVMYMGESSTSMAPGSWTPLANLATPPEYVFATYASPQRLYLRVRVTVP